MVLRQQERLRDRLRLRRRRGIPLPTGSFLNFLKSSAITAKIEYLRYDLGSSTFLATNRVATNIGSAYSTRVDNEGNLVRVGLNYKF